MEIAFCYFRYVLESGTSWPESGTPWPDFVKANVVSVLSRIHFLDEATRNRPPLSWSRLFRNSRDSECSVQCDRIYALNGLVDKRWQLQPNYDISEKDLLRDVLQSELAAQLEKNNCSGVDYRDLYALIRQWSFVLKFQPVRPSGWIDQSYLRVDVVTARYNVHLVFQELGIPVPVGLSLAAPEGRKKRIEGPKNEWEDEDAL